MSSMLHHLKIILKMNFTSLRLVTERILQGETNITRGGKPNNLNQSFFSERGKKKTEHTLIMMLPINIFRIWRRNITGKNDCSEHRDGTVNMAKKILTLEQRDKLRTPKKKI